MTSATIDLTYTTRVKIDTRKLVSLYSGPVPDNENILGRGAMDEDKGFGANWRGVRRRKSVSRDAQSGGHARRSGGHGSRIDGDHRDCHTPSDIAAADARSNHCLCRQRLRPRALRQLGQYRRRLPALGLYRLTPPPAL